MKKLLRPITLGILALGLFACEQNDALDRQQATDTQSFEMTSSLGGIEILEVSSNPINGEEVRANEDDLRANLHYNGVNAITTTTFSASDLGIRMNGNSLKVYSGTPKYKINARWGVRYTQSGSTKYLAENCKQSVTTPQLSVDKNIVYFQPNGAQSTINGAKVKMYCHSAKTIPYANIKKGWMCLDGVEGAEANSTKQYFMASQGGRAIKTDPNDRIEGVAQGNFQAGRHIPVMTEVLPFAELSNPKAANNTRFSPRGTLIGLCLKNELGANITITGIVVEKAGTFNYSGYFNWAVNSGKATFTPQYTASQNTTALVFPVYTKGSNSIGYNLAKNNSSLPCFYVWGMQKSAKNGNALQVQVRYKVAGSSAVKTSMTFNIYPPEIGGVKKFHEGYAYNAVVKLTDKNKTGGSTGYDWDNGGVLPINNHTVNDEHNCPENITGGKTPLDFLAEYNVNYAPAGQRALRTSHSFPQTIDGENPWDDKTLVLTANDAGIYTWAEATALFNGSNPALASYKLPSAKQWLSIVPEESQNGSQLGLGRVRPLQTKITRCEVGSSGVKNYTDESIIIDEGGAYKVAYALRFKGTEWESAWRYSLEGTQQEENLKLKIQSVGGLQGTGVQLHCIIKEGFFTNTSYPITTRIIPVYGIPRKESSGGFSLRIKSRVRYSSSSTYVNGSETYVRSFMIYGTSSGLSTNQLNDYLYVRPFYKQLP